MSKMYCQGCDWSFSNDPVMALPSACPKCGSMAFASWPRHMMAPVALLNTSATCSTCGFRYWEHQGHIIPCPVCAADALRARLDEADGSRASLYDALNQEFRECGLPWELEFNQDARPAVRALVDVLRAKVGEAEDALTVRIRGECCCPSGECGHLPLDPWVARAFNAERRLTQAEAQLAETQADAGCQYDQRIKSDKRALAAEARVEAMREAAKVVEEYESDAFAEFSNQRDKLKAISHLDGIATAIRALEAGERGEGKA